MTIWATGRPTARLKRLLQKLEYLRDEPLKRGKSGYREAYETAAKAKGYLWLWKELSTNGRLGEPLDLIAATMKRAAAMETTT